MSWDPATRYHRRPTRRNPRALTGAPPVPHTAKTSHQRATEERRPSVRCPRCQHENVVGAKFCVECGARLTSVGEVPRVESPDAYTPAHLATKILSVRDRLAGERKQVTVLFADLKGSLELLADRDPEDARALLDTVLERMMEAVHRYEGTVNQVMGDGIMALFGAPVAHEDHAVRACYAALRMHRAMARCMRRA